MSLMVVAAEKNVVICKFVFVTQPRLYELWNKNEMRDAEKETL